MDWSHILFSLNGRIGQKAYWYGVLIIIAGNFISNFIPFLGFLVGLGMIWVGISVYGKRLHDAGKTAWIHAIPWGLSLLLNIVAFAIFGGALIDLALNGGFEDPTADDIMSIISASGGAILFFILSFFVWVGYTIWTGALNPDLENNRYGPAAGGVGTTPDGQDLDDTQSAQPDSDKDSSNPD